MTEKRALPKKTALIIYVLTFYGVRTTWELWVKPFITAAVPDAYLSQLVKSGVIKNIVWVLPAVLPGMGAHNASYVLGSDDVFVLLR